MIFKSTIYNVKHLNFYFRPQSRRPPLSFDEEQPKNAYPSSQGIVHPDSNIRESLEVYHKSGFRQTDHAGDLVEEGIENPNEFQVEKSASLGKYLISLPICAEYIGGIFFSEKIVPLFQFPFFLHFLYSGENIIPCLIQTYSHVTGYIAGYISTYVS